MKRLIIISVALCFNVAAFSQGIVVFQDTDGSDLTDTVELFYEQGMDYLTFDCFISNTDTANGYKIRLKRIVKQSVPDATDILSFGIYLSEFSATQVEGMTEGGDSIYKNSKVSTTQPWELITYKPDSTEGLAIYQYFILSETNTPGVFVNQDSVIVKYDLTGVGVFDGKVLANNYIESYPNPANEKIWVRFQIQETTNTVLSVYNVLGKRIISRELEGSNCIHELSLQDWNSGLYLLSIESQGKTVLSKKFLKK